MIAVKSAVRIPFILNVKLVILIKCKRKPEKKKNKHLEITKWHETNDERANPGSINTVGEIYSREY